MKNFFLIMILFGNISCLSQISKTPKGVEPTPLYLLQLPDNLDVSTIIFSDSNFVKKYNCRLGGLGGLYENWISVPPTNDTIKDIFRNIEIHQFKKYDDALKRYLYSKKTIDTSERLYKEEKQGANRYFIIYKRIRLDYNHGIPCGIYNDPELSLGFLLNKYFISISYADYRYDKKKKVCYVCDINNDILLVAKILNDVVSLASTESAR